MSDLISRQAAINEIARWIGYIDEDMIFRIQTGLKKVPSAQRTGRWIPVAGRMGKEVQCDCCGEVFWYWLTNFTYCPNCGAKMEEQQ